MKRGFGTLDAIGGLVLGAALVLYGGHHLDSQLDARRQPLRAVGTVERVQPDGLYLAYPVVSFTPRGGARRTFEGVTMTSLEWAHLDAGDRVTVRYSTDADGTPCIDSVRPMLHYCLIIAAGALCLFTARYGRDRTRLR